MEPVPISSGSSCEIVVYVNIDTSTLCTQCHIFGVCIDMNRRVLDTKQSRFIYCPLDKCFTSDFAEQVVLESRVLLQGRNKDDRTVHRKFVVDVAVRFTLIIVRGVSQDSVYANPAVLPHQPEIQGSIIDEVEKVWRICVRDFQDIRWPVTR